LWNPLFKGAINVLAADADYSVAVDMMQLTGLPMFWGDSCFPGATNCTGIGGPVMGPKGCLANGGCWEMADNWEAAVDAEAAQLKPLIENGTVVGIFVGDEMVCNGLPFHDFQKLVTKIRAAVGPSVKLWSNECCGTITGSTHYGWAHIPIELDIISTDCYSVPGKGIGNVPDGTPKHWNGSAVRVLSD
jgi:hypothetical protein